MKLSRHVYTGLGEKIVHAVLGLVLFFLLNVALVALFLLLISNAPGTWNNATGHAAYGLMSLLLNVGLLIYFGFTRYWIALGALVVCVIWFVVVLLLSPQCFGLNPASISDGNGWPSMAS